MAIKDRSVNAIKYCFWLLGCSIDDLNNRIRDFVHQRPLNHLKPVGNETAISTAETAQNRGNC